MRNLLQPTVRDLALALAVVVGFVVSELSGGLRSAQAQAPPRPVPSIPTPTTQPPVTSSPAPTSARAKKQAKFDADPVVMSAEAAAQLRQPTARDNRYGGPTDWRDVPAWRQASFFGLRAEGRVFIFVVDRSGSMTDDDRLSRAKRELIRSVNAMQPPQRFQVIFYNDRASFLGELPKTADYPSKDRLARWLSLIDADGETDPRAALSLALGQRPDAVFLLSDGAFPDETAATVARLNLNKIPIHCVDLADGAAGDDLKTIARESGGQYTSGRR